ncbi:hypothetical protein [Planktothrix paucivesiculata]|uniref:Uncharacterized protein n=1 Tax=Planktothrix paucivesiculata PCC 9631 TaxID=671071 RepID=A0A7Z9BQ40_9CYAN|nr:hypothetical protein [Planktothrix paucivesiculata]VXD17224.1 hypothetical protein PL9631_320015 [Planktothrix paucivesiculata PCC 9631]
MQTTTDLKSPRTAENDLQGANQHRADPNEANLSNEILTDQLPPELLSAYRGMTQSSSLLYGVPNIWESSEVQYDPARSVLDSVRRYNTPDKLRTQELAIAIHNICKDFATKPQISVQDEGGEFLLKGFLYLQILIKSITATDFILGLGGKAIVERGGERSERKGELSAILQKIQVSESSLDWADLSNEERYLIAALCVFALKDSNQTIIEEINRTVDPLHLPLELAKRLSILEVNLKQSHCFLGSGSQLLASK